MKDALSSSVEERKKRGEINRAFVIARYGIEKMTSDALGVYRSLLEQEKTDPDRRVLISGYYGFGNMGDESLCTAILSDLRACDPSLCVTVISGDPKKTARDRKVNAIRRLDLPALFSEEKKGGLLLSGGGSLLTDASSLRSLAYYAFVIRTAKAAGMKTMLYANGVGPFRTRRAKKIARTAIESADLVTLRDPDSLKEIADMGVDPSEEKFIVTSDPAFGLSPSDGERMRFLAARDGIDLEKRFFVVSPRPWKGTGENFADEIADFCRKLAGKTGALPIFLPMQPSSDTRLCEKIAARCGGKILSPPCVSDALFLLGRADLVVGMRLHALIYAAAAGAPLIGLSYDPKVDAVLRYAGFPSDHVLPVVGLLADELFGKAEALLQESGSEKSFSTARGEEMRRKAAQSASLAFALAGWGTDGKKDEKS